MTDKRRIRRGPLLVLAGLGGTGLAAAGIWLAAASGSSPDTVPVAAREAAASVRTPSAVPSPTCGSFRPRPGTPSPVPSPPPCDEPPSASPVPTRTPAPVPPSAVPAPAAPPVATPSPAPPGHDPTARPVPPPAKPSHGG
ncbi:Uncharacterised protein [Mycobacterium tuberculosis]|nr:Uncharacterised protein [Mycobacterium tuberculosis]